MIRYCCDCGADYETTQEEFDAQEWPVCPACRKVNAENDALRAARDALCEAAVKWRKAPKWQGAEGEALNVAVDAYIAAKEGR